MHKKERNKKVRKEDMGKAEVIEGKNWPEVKAKKMQTNFNLEILSTSEFL